MLPGGKDHIHIITCTNMNKRSKVCTCMEYPVLVQNGILYLPLRLKNVLKGRSPTEAKDSFNLILLNRHIYLCLACERLISQYRFSHYSYIKCIERVYG